MSDTLNIGYKNYSNLRKGLFLFSVIYLLSVSFSVVLANTTEIIDPSEKKSKVRNEEDPQFKTDSTEVSEQAKPFNP